LIFYPSRIQGSERQPDPESGSASKNLSIFNPKKWFLISRKYDPGCSSLIPNPDLDFCTHPGSRGQKGNPIPNPDQHQRI
jgi:hypothetical protein